MVTQNYFISGLSLIDTTIYIYIYIYRERERERERERARDSAYE
jgi:hypothetical protein